MSNDHFSRLEDRIQWLVEGGFARLFSGQLHPRDVATQLIKAVEDSLLQPIDGISVAPDIYLIRLNPDDQRMIVEDQPDLADTLCNEIVSFARESGYTLNHHPQVRLLADHLVSPHQIAVNAVHTEEERESTQSLKEGMGWEVPRPPSADAFLMLGNRRIQLDRPVINLGRYRDNHIILDDPNVSRHHAQIRLRFGQYSIFDLGSKAGILVNGQSVQEAVLKPGDVIALATSTLIYFQSGSQGDVSESSSDTDLMPSPAGE
jgi:FHA domain-containing protein